MGFRVCRASCFCLNEVGTTVAKQQYFSKKADSTCDEHGYSKGYADGYNKRYSQRCYMGGCTNYGPFLGALNIRCRIIIRTPKGTLILTTTPMCFRLSGVSGWGLRGFQGLSLEASRRSFHKGLL